jgi:glycogen synthase
LTIHNLAFQGVFGHRVLEIAGVPHVDFEVPEVATPTDTVTLLWAWHLLCRYYQYREPKLCPRNPRA